MYNMSFTDNGTGFVELMQGVNTITNNLFGVSVLFAIFIVAFVSLKGQYDSLVSVAGSSFLILLVGIAFWGLGILDIYILIIPLLTLIISAVWSISND